MSHIMIEYKKSSAVSIFNDEGELLLQLRAANDDSFPSHWDFAAGGGVDEGEDEKRSAERETMEEVGVSVTVPSSRTQKKSRRWNFLALIR